MLVLCISIYGTGVVFRRGGGEGGRGDPPLHLPPLTLAPTPAAPAPAPVLSPCAAGVKIDRPLVPGTTLHIPVLQGLSFLSQGSQEGAAAAVLHAAASSVAPKDGLVAVKVVWSGVARQCLRRLPGLVCVGRPADSLSCAAI